MSYPNILRSSSSPNKNNPVPPLPLARRASRPSSSLFFYIHPLLQEGVLILTSISTTMSNFPNSILNMLGLSPNTTPSPPNMTSMVSKLVTEQHRTMFYTVTMSPTVPTQQKTKEKSKPITPSLKWKYASSLTKTQTVLTRTNHNSPNYYTFTYMGEEGIQENFTREKMDRKLSQVKIYINT